jgi:hypothetical protein
MIGNLSNITGSPASIHYFRPPVMWQAGDPVYFLDNIYRVGRLVLSPVALSQIFKG